jgi:hypothetical protein
MFLVSLADLASLSELMTSPANSSGFLFKLMMMASSWNYDSSLMKHLSFVILKHVCDEFVGSITLHLAKAHGAHMDATGTNDAGDFGVHECRVSPLRLWACDCTVASTMVVQELRREVAASHGDGGPSRNIAINQESGILAKGPKLREGPPSPWLAATSLRNSCTTIVLATVQSQAHRRSGDTRHSCTPKSPASLVPVASMWAP